ncbi:hypothetical protein KJ966_27630 [bacterium]|nr:hypothetical protein [bacterium]
MESTRVKINLQSGEIEFEGSEEFVQNQIDNLDSVIKLLSSVKTTAITQRSDIGETEPMETDSETDENTQELNNNNSNGEISVPNSFGEWLHKFKDDINDLEKCLVTAFFEQKNSQQNDFKTREVNNALKEHGIKLTNPSTSLKRLVEKKLLFQTRKNGTVKFMRVSQDGMQLLKSLLR